MDKSLMINIHRILVFIRFDIRNPINIKLLESIVECIREKSGNGKLLEILSDEQHIIKQLLLEESELYENRNNIDEFLLIILEDILNMLNSGDYDIAYEMVDLIHILPELIISNNKKDLRVYWKLNIKQYSKKKKNDLAKKSKKYFY